MCFTCERTNLFSFLSSFQQPATVEATTIKILFKQHYLKSKYDAKKEGNIDLTEDLLSLKFWSMSPLWRFPNYMYKTRRTTKVQNYTPGKVIHVSIFITWSHTYAAKVLSINDHNYEHSKHCHLEHKMPNKERKDSKLPLLHTEKRT